MKPTIKDIQKMTGLSAATISRAISGNGYVSAKNRELIYSAQKELGYFPHQPSDAALSSRHNSTVLVVLPPNQNPIWFELLRGVFSICEEQSYFPLISFCDPHDLLKKPSNQFIHSGSLAGIILVTLGSYEEMADVLPFLTIPKVLCSFYVYHGMHINPNCDYIAIDSRKGTYLATSHMIEQGYTSLGFVGISSCSALLKERFSGFQEALKAANLPFHPEWVFSSDLLPFERIGYQAVLQFSQSGALPNGIVCINDECAIGVHKACQDLGISIPSQIGIIGMDDIGLSYNIVPSLSSVELSPQNIGHSSAMLLFNRIHTPDSLFQKIILEPKLIAKGSSLRLP